MAKLKPCPFCGGTNIDCLEAGFRTGVWFVQCDECYATFPDFDSEAEAIKAWNRRAKDEELLFTRKFICDHGLLYKLLDSWENREVDNG